MSGIYRPLLRRKSHTRKMTSNLFLACTQTVKQSFPNAPLLMTKNLFVYGWKGKKTEAQISLPKAHFYCMWLSKQICLRYNATWQSIMSGKAVQTNDKRTVCLFLSELKQKQTSKKKVLLASLYLSLSYTVWKHRCIIDFGQKSICWRTHDVQRD